MRTLPLIALFAAWLITTVAPLIAQPPTGRRCYRTVLAPRGNFFGESHAMLGDLDGDRHSEYVIGNRSELIFYDGKTGKELGPLVPVPTGLGVAPVGDIDADGVPDFAVGDSRWNNSTGEVRVYSGKTFKQLYRFAGGRPIDKFGSSIAGPGDVDGDGHDDVLIGAHMIGQQWSPGYAVVYSGKNGGVIRRWDGRPNTDDVIGLQVSAIGDVDKDRKPDVMVARWTGVDILSPLTGRLLVTIPVARISTLDRAGDADRDGTPDVVVGVGARTEIYSTKTQKLLGSLDGQSLGLRMNRVAWLGDVTGDGWDEIVSVGYQIGVVGVLQIVTFDAAGKPSVIVSKRGAGRNDLFGFTVSAGEDISGDGLPDVMVGASQPNGVGNGYVHIASPIKLHLQTDTFCIPASGGSQTLNLHTDTGLAGKPYWLLGSFTAPGAPLVVDDCRFPLAIDPYTIWTFTNPNTAILANSRGSLDASSRATARLNLPASSLLVGTTLWHAYFVMDGARCAQASNFIPVTITR